MPATRLLAAAALGYVAGTAPSAAMAAQVASGGLTDIRAAGTGNPGAANAIAVLGARWGVAVMVADIAKGAAACGLGRRLAGAGGAHLAGTAAVVGHCFPAWNGFRGGKGVATSVGQVIATFPAYAPFDLAVAAATHARPGWRNRAHSATAAACVAWLGGAALWWRRGWPNLWGPPAGPGLVAGAAASSAVILWRFHQEEQRSRARQAHDAAAVTGAEATRPPAPGS